MYTHYLNLAARHLLRNPVVSAINIIGLSIGLAATLMILLYVREELSYDQFWPEGETLFKVETDIVLPDERERQSPGAVDPLRDIFLERYASVIDAALVRSLRTTSRVGETLHQNVVTYADHNYFDLFKHEFIEGDSASAFADPQSVVLTESAARRHFGDGPWLNKTLDLAADEYHTLRVTGIVKDLPRSTSFEGELFVPVLDRYLEIYRPYTQDWQFTFRELYLKLADPKDAQAIRADLPLLIDQHMPTTIGGMEGRYSDMVLYLHALKDVYMEGAQGGGDYNDVIGFTSVALIILFIALANFVNLSMAQAQRRTREAAVRKVVGASTADFWRQFTLETVLIMLTSLILGYSVVELTLPVATEFLASLSSVSLFSSPTLLALAVIALLVIGLAVGGIHATIFSRVKPSRVLKGQVSADGGKSPFKTALVVVQFGVAIALMTVSTVIYQQTQYSQNLRLGFEPDSLFVVYGTNNQHGDRFKRQLLENPAILSVGRSSDAPTLGSEDRLTIRSLEGVETTLDGLPIDEDFFEVYDIPLAAGRMLDRQVEADVLRRRGGPNDERGGYREAAGFVINRLGAERLGFKSVEEAIGYPVTVNLSTSRSFEGRIVGVSETFHFDSSRNDIRASVYYVDEERWSHMAVRFAPGHRVAALDHLTAVWRDVYPDRFLEYSAMEELVSFQYDDIRQLGSILTGFTALAIILAVLGLYGMASLSAGRKTKEIGIRRTLGATRVEVTAMMMWQFSKPVLIAVLLAWPVAALFLTTWLEGFAYRINLSPLWFGLSGAGALFVSWTVIALHVWRMAGRSPVLALRHD